MNLVILVSIILIVVVMTIAVLHFLLTNLIKSALTSLLTILAGLAAATTTPELSGKGEIFLNLGPFGKILAHAIEINPSQPTWSWYVAFISVSTLLLVTIYFAYDIHKSKS
jgi:hypothetical protein